MRNSRGGPGAGDCLHFHVYLSIEPVISGILDQCSALNDQFVITPYTQGHVLALSPRNYSSVNPIYL